MKNGRIGHAWIVLKSPDEEIEGGHSGDLGIMEPGYLEGVFLYIDQKDQNPIRYLWREKQDGFFQKGSGGYRPTIAVKCPLSKKQFFLLKEKIGNYPYQSYSLHEKQCVLFVVSMAKEIGLSLESKVTIPIKQTLKVGTKSYKMWQDPKYQSITLASPDILEKSLRRLVMEKKGILATKEYLKNHPLSFKQRLSNQVETVTHFPRRFSRFLIF